MGELKNRTPLGNAVDNKLLAEFKEVARVTKIPQSKLLDEAIEDLIKKYSTVIEAINNKTS